MMYRARLKTVATYLWNGSLSRPVFRSAASLPAAICATTSRPPSSLSLLLASSVAVPLALSVLETNRVHCDDPEKKAASDKSVSPAASAPEAPASSETVVIENPLWPSGVSVDMVNEYVDQILADPDINIKSVPDSMERVIYVSTVRLTLNTVYEVLSWLHGTEVLGHRLVLDRLSVKPDEKVLALNLEHRLGRINVKVLEAMADELLKNKAINQWWVPDIIERQIYANCMRIIFTIIDGIADTMAFHMCGHSLSLRFEPIDPETARKLVQRYHGKGIEIDEEALDAICDETMKESQEASPVPSFISYLPGYGAFMKSLHKTLCKLFMRESAEASIVNLSLIAPLISLSFCSLDSLILGIIDDILSKTDLLVLDDRIRISVVPESRYVTKQSTSNVEGGTKAESVSVT